jgi:hypothetical protein
MNIQITGKNVKEAVIHTIAFVIVAYQFAVYFWSFIVKNAGFAADFLQNPVDFCCDRYIFINTELLYFAVDLQPLRDNVPSEEVVGFAIDRLYLGWYSQEGFFIGILDENDALN